MLKDKKIAIIILTPAAKKIALKLKKVVSSLDIYSPNKLKDKNNQFYYFNSFKTTINDIFNKYDGIVFIMALGIVVRIIAPLLNNKKTDPAVITIDDSGQNVISTLSGHLGGANLLTVEIAAVLDSNPVITTATDCSNQPAFDLLAQKLNCKIEPFKRLKKANGALLFGKEVHIYTDYKIHIKETKKLKKHSLNYVNNKIKDDVFEVIISNQQYKLKENQLQLIPRNIIIGIGCRKNISFFAIKSALNSILIENNLSRESIKKLATIDLKKNEKGILKLAEKNDWPLEIITRKKIREIEDSLKIKKSDFVKKTIGVAAAAAPAAILASNNGELIVDKQKYAGITLAVFEEEIESE
ncbi:cobalt-precorrin 5A hydrolase [Halanaerobium sp. MA284_MarDTE_T2]|uniref:cobalt-precorrin 5A hydrolase n=1 Tax=Halanaerobium sp. MA284_MarDTE_T2 TaxID=2183913 RepID=UPI000DF132C2|nr:cobalt-precorrin 5A hydrolase [Halanaerobium sp. MA284_MarDTE_T2]RCW50445.1 cobalt-precorrin 5A acetaldehyde-lyase [Halanaerobium sp. MA284_MarDTE_T2]